MPEAMPEAMPEGTPEGMPEGLNFHSLLLGGLGSPGGSQSQLRGQYSIIFIVFLTL